VVDVGFARDPRIPVARRQLLHARERVAARPLDVVLVEQLGQIGIGVDDADDVAPPGGHGGVIPRLAMSDL
jgi:hypothetical protein